MKRIAMWMWCLLLVLSAGASLWGQAVGGAGRKTATASAATQPAGADAQKAAATREDDDEEDDDKSTEAIIQAANRSFVIVRTWYKKDPTEPVAQAGRNWQTARLYEDYIDKKRPAEVPGLVLDDKGHVLIIDDGIEDRFIEKIEVLNAAGKHFAAKRAKLLYEAPGIVLKVAEAGGDLKPPQFVPLDEKGVNTKLLQARVIRVDDKWRVQVGPLHPGMEYTSGKSENVFYGYRGGSGFSRRYSSSYLPALVADEDGRPVGCALAAYLDLAQAECIWKGADLVRSDALAWKDFSRAVETCRKKLIAATQEIVIKFHQGSGRESERYMYSEGPSASAGREISAYGVAISDREIFVPMTLDRKTAAQIDSIYVKYSATDRKAANFVGAYKDFAAFVVRLDKGKLPAYVQLAEADPPRMRPFLVATMRKKQGKKYVDLMTNRIQGKTRGYAGKFHWVAGGQMTTGALMVDFKGRLLGASLVQRIEHEEERQYQRSGRYSGRSEARIFTISELRDDLRDPKAHLDAKIKVKTKVQAKRRTWLGVEFVPISPALAEQLKVEAPTRDGQLGFIINAVYAGSPAQKLGLKVGDILLKLQAPGMREPIELAARLGRRRSYGFRWPGMGGLQASGGPLPPSWKTRENILTQMLDAIGADKTLRLTYHRSAEDGKGKTVTLKYKIQQAPPDFQSAPRWQNRKLGLTVKDVTYEIRHALNLTGPAPGVVVAKTERGSPVEIARVFPNEIIIRLDDKPLKSSRQMRDLVAAARKAGRKKVRLTILRLGKTRFADLTITIYNAADDEGLDER